MIRSFGSASGLLLGLFLGCGPNPNPAVVMVLMPNANGDLETTQVELQTVQDLTTLKGTATQFVGGAQVFVDTVNGVFPTSLGPGMDQTFYVTVMKDAGRPVQASFIDKSGVLWPADFHSWNMVTAFYNFERSYLYFKSVYGAKDPVELNSMRVLYWADVRFGEDPAWVDNAVFLSLIKSFVIAPFQVLQQVPLAMNIGTIGHEMAHRVFNAKALADSALSPALDWRLEPFNLLKSIDEGFADFHGYGVTCGEPSKCQAAFLTGSLPADEAEARNLARTDLCLDDVTLRDLQNSTAWTAPGSKMYVYGTLWASALYHGANKAPGAQAMGDLQKALIASYDDATPTRPGLKQLIATGESPDSFTPEAVADIILSHISEDTLRAKVCSEMLTRLRLSCTTDGLTHCTEMPHCPAESVADQCPP